MVKRKTVTRGDDPLVKRRRFSDDNSGVLEASCCSSNGSAERERVASVDPVQKNHEDSVDGNETITCNLEDQYRYERDDRFLRETINSSESYSGEMESPENKSPPAKTPPQDEIEKFFAAAEKEQQKYYTEKYNYDFAKDVPLEGRYEWVLIKP